MYLRAQISWGAQTFVHSFFPFWLQICTKQKLYTIPAKNIEHNFSPLTLWLSETFSCHCKFCYSVFILLYTLSKKGSLFIYNNIIIMYFHLPVQFKGSQWESHNFLSSISQFHVWVLQRVTVILQMLLLWKCRTYVATYLIPQDIKTI